MFTTSSTVWTGVFSNTLQAQDWYIKSDDANAMIDIMSIAIGGLGDYYIIVGTNPIEVVADFQNFVSGLPTMPPIYALGWNQCRWGYEDTADLQDVVAGYEDNGIPLDVQWSDIDYMFNYRNF